MEFAQAAASLGLRAIHGAEMALEDGRHLTLLVEDARGWRNLCRMLTARTSTTATRPSRRPRVPLAVLEQHAEGLVCLSGCARQGVHDEPTLRRLLRTFGADPLRVELQRPFHRHDRARNRGLAELAERLGVPCVATGNVHAHTRSRAPLQDAFVAMREHATLDASEPLRRGNYAHVLTTPEAMAARFEDHPRAVAETRALADRLTFDLSQDLGYRYPGAEDPEADRKLAELCAQRFEERYPPGNPHRAAARPRLEEELRVIARSGCRASSSCTATCSSSRARSPSRCAGPTRRARCCRRGAAAAPRCPRSSATSPASRTSTRSPTSCSSGASSTRRSRRCRTSTSTSRATSARS